MVESGPSFYKYIECFMHILCLTQEKKCYGVVKTIRETVIKTHHPGNPSQLNCFAIATTATATPTTSTIFTFKIACNIFSLSAAVVFILIVWFYCDITDGFPITLRFVETNTLNSVMDWRLMFKQIYFWQSRISAPSLSIARALCMCLSHSFLSLMLCVISLMTFLFCLCVPPPFSHHHSGLHVNA